MEARPHLAASGIPKDILFRIWEMSDITGDGKLNAHEYAIAMLLVEAFSRNALPDALPSCLTNGWKTALAPGSAMAPARYTPQASVPTQGSAGLQPASGGSIRSPLPSPRELLQPGVDQPSSNEAALYEWAETLNPETNAALADHACDGTLFTSEWTSFDDHDDVFTEAPLESVPDASSSVEKAYTFVEQAPLPISGLVGKAEPDVFSARASVPLLAMPQMATFPASVPLGPPSIDDLLDGCGSALGANRESAALAAENDSSRQRTASPRERFYTASSQHEGTQSPLALASPPSYPPPPPASKPAMKAVAAQDAVVRMVCGLPLSVDDFTASRQTKIRQAIANTSGVSLSKVKIQDLAPVSGKSVRFRIEITEDRSVAQEVARRLTTEAINAQLASSGGPNPLSIPGNLESPTVLSHSQSQPPLSKTDSPPPIFPPPPRPDGLPAKAQQDSPPPRKIPPPPPRHTSSVALASSAPPINVSYDPFAGFLETLCDEKERYSQKGEKCEPVPQPALDLIEISPASSVVSDEGLALAQTGDKARPLLQKSPVKEVVPRLWFPGETPRNDSTQGKAALDAPSGVVGQDKKGWRSSETGGGDCGRPSAQTFHPIASSRLEDLQLVGVGGKVDSRLAAVGGAWSTDNAEVQELQHQVSCIQHMLVMVEAEEKKEEQDQAMARQIHGKTEIGEHTKSKEEARRRRDERAKAEEDIRYVCACVRDR